jgi:hypothetical protein
MLMLMIVAKEYELLVKDGVLEPKYAVSARNFAMMPTPILI